MSRTEFQNNIRLITKEKIEKPYALLFLRVVKETGPDSIHKPVQITDEIGERKTIDLRYYKNKKKGHVYEIPLTRNLVPAEAEKIVIAWSQMYENGDFVIDTSIPYIDSPQIEDDKVGIAKTNDNYEQLKAEAKEKHNRWVDEKVNDGWRFGEKESSRNLTHPMIKDWEELPELYKEKFMVIESKLFEGPKYLLPVSSNYGVEAKEDYIYENPVKSVITNLLRRAKHAQLRAIYFESPKPRLFVWDAWNWIHYSAVDLLKNQHIIELGDKQLVELIISETSFVMQPGFGWNFIKNPFRSQSDGSTYEQERIADLLEKRLGLPWTRKSARSVEESIFNALCINNKKGEQIGI